MGAGNPKKSNVGNVNNVPPPAIVLINPAINPIGISNKSSVEKSIVKNQMQR